MRFTTRLLPSRANNVGVLLLNNPKALHALTMDMIYCLQDVMNEWKDDSTLRTILIKSSDAKRPAFCAGGDVKAVYEKGIIFNDDSEKTKLHHHRPEDFFFHEYQVNYSIATSTIPIVSLWDGIVMGGGVGISIHGKYRIATENTIFAMPETAIGLFPDVGSMYWMPRLLSTPVANYLALTGKRIDAADLLYTGLATHYVPSKNLPELESALIEASDREVSSSSSSGSSDGVASILMSFHETIPTNECHLAKNGKDINENFNETSLEDIFSNLMKPTTTESTTTAATTTSTNDDFASTTLQALQKLSPTSMKITLEGLQRGKNVCKTIGDDLQMEYRMARACMKTNSDFYEGIRAVLIDKDHKPSWNPSKPELVTKEYVETFFEPIENEWSVPKTHTTDTTSKL